MKKERPILFNGDMVRAILDGRKKQTRRPVSPQSAILTDEMARNLGVRPPHIENFPVIKCPFGQVGDRLWVRETWGPLEGGACYRASESPLCKPDGGKWFPSIHMPRWACRIVLEITNIRVERVQYISEDDAIADGGLEAMVDDHVWYIPGYDSKTTRDPISAFGHVWNSCYSARGLGWDANPWVWVVEFKRVEA